ncbi:MAG: PorT family protein [Rhodothermales bacterium]|nr:PorT family protein [Rhodothermales bacterium]
MRLHFVRGFLVALFLLFSATAVFGQFHVGVTAGPQLTKIDMKFKSGEVPEVDLVLGFHMGAAIGYDIGVFTIRSGLNYENAGGLFDGASFFQRSHFDVNFVTIPVDLRFRFNRRGVLRPYIFAGPEFRYALSLEDTEFVLKDDLSLANASFAAGVGLSIRIPYVPFRFSPEIRYASDLTGIYSGELETDDGGILETAESVKANAVKIGILMGF